MQRICLLRRGFYEKGGGLYFLWEKLGGGKQKKEKRRRRACVFIRALSGQKPEHTVGQLRLLIQLE